MFLELAEALDCPRCREAYGLVTFVTRADRRRVLEGHLGCPLCEVEFPVVGGAIRFGAPDAGTRPEEAPGGRHTRQADRTGAPAGEGPAADPETPVRLAALLGLGEGSGRVVLLGPGLGALAVAVAGLVERVEILAWSDPGPAPERWEVEDLARGVNPVLGADPARWPVRGGALGGVALARPDPITVAEAVRGLRPDGRLVLLEPGEPALEALPESGVEELASDPVAWVGRRL